MSEQLNSSRVLEAERQLRSAAQGGDRARMSAGVLNTALALAEDWLANDTVDRPGGRDPDPSPDACDGGAEHDWRIDPRLLVIENAPGLNLQCAVCEARTSSGPIDVRKLPSNAHDWPMYDL